MKSTTYGLDAERSFLRFARGRRAKIYFARQHENYDFELNGKHIEFKSARPRRLKRGFAVWTFNLHRHGVLNEKSVHYYVLCFEQIPLLGINFYGAIKAPLGVKTLRFGMALILKRAEPMNRLFEKIVRRSHERKTSAGHCRV